MLFSAAATLPSPMVLSSPMLQAVLNPAALAITATILLVASFNDIASRILPNRMALALLPVGLLLRTADATILPAIAAAALVFAAALFCWFRGWFGGGDVKLLAACCLLVPPAQVIQLLLSTALAGGVLSLAYLALGRLDLSPGTLPAGAGLVRRVVRVERWRISRGAPLPYGCAIACAALLGQYAAWRG